MEILIKRLNEQAKLPAYSREAGPGIDLYTVGEVVIAPGTKALVSTGVAVAMPVGYIGLIWNQNSMAFREALEVTSAIVDSGNREEIVVEIKNTSSEERRIGAGEKLAQVLVQKVELANLIEAEDLSNFEG